MIGLFELNAFDRGMVYGHALGVVLGCGIPMAGIIQGEALGGYHLICPVVLSVVAFVCLAYWRWIARYSNVVKWENDFMEKIRNGQKLNDEDLKVARREINKIALQCIVSEGSGMLAAVAILVIYLYQWSNTCK